MRFILVVSIAAQLAAAVLALRLIRVTERRLPWALIATAITLMAVRRVDTLYALSTDPSSLSVLVSAEVIALIISVFLLIGLASIIPMFRSIRDSERQARESEVRFRALATVSPTGIYRADTDGNYVYLNERWSEIAGLTLQEASGSGWIEGVHPDDRERVRGEWATATTQKGPFRSEFRFQDRAGRITWVLAQALAIDEANADLSGYVGTITDINQRKLAEEELIEAQRAFQAMLQVSPAVLYRCGPGTVYATEFISENIRTLLGYEPEDFLQDPNFWSEQIHPDDRPQILEKLDLITDSTPLNYEYRFRRSDGSYIWLHDQVRPTVQDGRVVGLVGSWFDATARRTAEVALRDALADLESRVRVRTDDLLKANRQLEAEIAKRGEIETALRQSEERLSAILRYCPALVSMRDLDGRYIFVNPEFTDVFRLDEEQVIGRTDHELFPKAVADARAERDRRVIEQRTPIGYEETIPQDDALRTFMCQNFLLYDQDGIPRGICCISTDITARKQAEEALEKKSAELMVLSQEQKALLHHTRDFVYRHDADGVFNYIAPSVEQITGYSIDEWMKHYTAYMTDHPDNALVVGYTEETLATGRESPPYLVEIRHKDGHSITLEVNERPMWENDTVVGIIGVARDVTERIRAGEALKRAKEAAEAASRAKSIFLANLSHEIRTPIMAMMGAAELSADGQADRKLTERYRDIVLRNGRHLVSLINDLLDTARMEAGKIDIHRRHCSLPDVLANVRAATESLRHASEVALLFQYGTPVPVCIETDPTRLAQALINLVNNALKFTRKGHVLVTTSVAPHDPDPRLTITVRDTGSGIPPDAQDRIFESFAQVGRPAPGSIVGVGLGLPLAKAIAEQLDGDLRVESRVGEGSTFTLRVATGELTDTSWIAPSDLEDAPLTAMDGGYPSEPLELSVLLAEDFRDTRELIRSALAQAGASVEAVPDGQQAIDAASRRPFDLILLDIRMPGIDGREAVARIREGGCTTPIIALTASTAPAGFDALLAAGFDDVWAKPITIADLLRRVARYSRAPSVDQASRTPSAAADGAADSTPDSDLQSKLAAVRAEFVASLPKKIGVLRDAARARNRSLMRERLHQLVGSAGIHGLANVSDEAVCLLQLAKNGDLDGVPVAFDRLAAMVDEVGTTPHRPHPEPTDQVGRC